MASRKVIRRLGALLHPSRGFCHKQELGGQLHPRSSSQLLAALEPHVTSSGKELFQVLIDVFCLEKEAWKQKEEFWKKKEAWKQEEEFWKQKEAWKQKDEYQKEACKQKQKEIEYQNKEIAYLEVDLLRSKGLNNTLVSGLGCLRREAHQYSTARCAEASSALPYYIQHSFAARARRSKYFSVLERRRSLTLKKTRLPGPAEEFRCGVLFVWSF
ncbi:hypothetical protein GOP47_0000268 [Adiantum capillus-veneris]|uniref:Uncharacterized protein n=1 Tax=Adiantum capillus-veneris TaxID=13818 RepID=A0A9D4ZQE5_ADICA|nr:hypothetical protein GOP47_0000268 [Adiantum capillus-veneris]